MKLRTVVVVAGILPLGCSGLNSEPTCPEEIRSGAACTAEAHYCPQPMLNADGCGVTGFTCQGGVWLEEMTTCNPPEPIEPEPMEKPPPKPQACPPDISAQTPCASDGKYCPQPDLDDNGCGVSGFTCQSGEWQREMTTCNPPPPPKPPDAGTP